MKINQNLSAMITNNQLLRTENSLSVAMERLSSGLKINHAKDDAAGMAISSQMQAQIDGIKRASQNASDGSSAIETADGALNEVTSMLQRMRELSVQAANGVNAQEDKQAIQDELSSLTEEIDRISRDTEFNTKSLLNGDMDYRVYANTNKVSRLQASDEVPAGDYKINVTSLAKQAQLLNSQMNTGTSIYDNTEGKINKDCTISINGYGITFEKGDTLDKVYEKLREGGEIAGVTVFSVDNSATEKIGDYGVGTWVGDGSDTLAFVSEQYGSSASISIQCDDPELRNLLGIVSTDTVYGEDAQANIETGNTTANNSFNKTATCVTDGNKITVTDRNGFRLSFYSELDATGTVNLEVTKIGAMTLQIGARENQSFDVTIPEISSKSLYIDDVDVTKVGGADKAIASYDYALERVLEARSKLGAYENRLDSAVASLDQTEENITQALSRITDVDMAEEMSEYTKYTVLAQATTSVLAQANDLPQQALQLLS